MVWTIVVHFVGMLGKRDAVLAFLVGFMLSLALFLDFCQIMLKTFMLHIPERVLTLHTVHASLARGMVACKLDILCLFFGHSQAIDAFPIWSMSAM